MEDRTWVNLRRSVNDYAAIHGKGACNLILDYKIVQTAFYVIDAAIKHDEKFADYLCSRKFNLMSLLYAYSSLVERGKIESFRKIDQAKKDELSNELSLWPVKWKEYYSEEKMLIIVYVAEHIAASILQCLENKTEYVLIKQ